MRNSNLLVSILTLTALVACSDIGAAAPTGATTSASDKGAEESDTSGSSAKALDATSAAKIVQAYAKTVACQIEDAEYKPVEVRSGDPELGGLGTLYVVHWQGDLGCSGGNGTVTNYFSVVEHRGFMSADPIVVLDYDFPDISAVSVTSFSSKGGTIHISGVKYGENDQQNMPTQKVDYQIGFDGGQFVTN